MDSPEKSDRVIAAEIGISPTTVGKARQLSSSGQSKKRIGKDGKKAFNWSKRDSCKTWPRPPSRPKTDKHQPLRFLLFLALRGANAGPFKVPEVSSSASTFGNFAEC
jgi:hypothetical protein